MAVWCGGGCDDGMVWCGDGVVVVVKMLVVNR